MKKINMLGLDEITYNFFLNNIGNKLRLKANNHIVKLVGLSTSGNLIIALNNRYVTQTLSHYYSNPDLWEEVA